MEIKIFCQDSISYGEGNTAMTSGGRGDQSSVTVLSFGRPSYQSGFIVWKSKMGFYDLIVEGNVLQTINAINTKHKNWSQFEHIVDGIQECMWLLRSCRIKHVN
jgi:hypothetical protein